MKADQRVGLKVGKLVVDLAVTREKSSAGSKVHRLVVIWADLTVDMKVDWMAVK